MPLELPARTERSNRRAFLHQALGLGGLASAGLGLSSIPALSAFAASQEMVIRGPAVPGQPVIQTGAHSYYVWAKDPFPTPQNQGFFGNAGFVVGEKGVAMFDSASSVQCGEMLIKQIRTVTDKPILFVINSHFHGDHFLGNHAFVEQRADIPIYAHPYTTAMIKGPTGESWRAMMERFTESATVGTVLTPPTHELTHGQEFDLGGVRVRAHHYGQAHTQSDVALEVVEDSVVFMGDVVMSGRIANPSDLSYLGTFRFLDEIQKATAAKVYVPAHGRHDAEVMGPFRELMTGIYEATKVGFEAGKMDFEMVEDVAADPRVAKFKHWAGFGDLGQFVSIAYLEVEKNAF